MSEIKIKSKASPSMPRSVPTHHHAHLDSHLLSRDKLRDHRQTQTERVS